MLPLRWKNALWRLGYGGWPAVPAPVDGYTLLLTVPPDLPVFLKLAVEICRRQDPTHLVETIVVPDRFDRRFRRHAAAAAAAWPEGRLRLVEPSWLDRAVRPLLRQPSLIHWLQLVAAGRTLRSTHAVLHDVDLFMLEPAFLRSLFETCRDRDLACVGSAPPHQDAPWARLPRFAHVVALWELTFAAAWLRANPPAAMRPQNAVFPEGKFWFETSLLAQANTDARRIARHRDADLVHFGWVIGGYRTFQRSRGPFEDDRLRLLLIRLLTDAFDPAGEPIDVPSHAELARGLRDAGARVRYGPAARASYPAFRRELERLLRGALFEADRTAALRRGLEPWDAAFGTDADEGSGGGPPSADPGPHGTR